MKLRPLIPEKRDERKNLVMTYQAWLNTQGAKLKVDGKFGDDTEAAAASAKPPAEVVVPPICVWTDRSWKDTAAFQRSLVTAQQNYGFKPARVGLFLNPLDEKAFKPFASASQLSETVGMLAEAGIDADLTAWIRPSKSYIDALLKYAVPVLNAWKTSRLDLDAESAWGSGSSVECADAAEYFHKAWKLGDRLSINDYASLQTDTRHLFRPGVRRRPQLYSVGYVAHSGSRVETTKSSVYYPGETQCYGMKASLWGGVAGDGPLDIGLAAYKPVVGMTVEQQVRAQVQAALWFKPQELWFWSLRTDSKFLSALGGLQG
jgi:hypothetical protein